MNTLEKVSMRLTNLLSIRASEDDFVISTALIINCTVPVLTRLTVIRQRRFVAEDGPW